MSPTTAASGGNADIRLRLLDNRDCSVFALDRLGIRSLNCPLATGIGATKSAPPDCSLPISQFLFEFRGGPVASAPKT